MCYPDELVSTLSHVVATGEKILETIRELCDLRSEKHDKENDVDEVEEPMSLLEKARNDGFFTSDELGFKPDLPWTPAINKVRPNNICFI